MDTVAISPRAMHSRLGCAASPLLLDLRAPARFEALPRIVPGALRPHADIVSFAALHAAGRPVVAYCVAGHEVSQEAARALARAGFDAAFLEGGLEAWIEARLPTVRVRADWGVPGRSRWITRARPKVDRIACPWLIRRFIDPLARIDYAPADRVLEEAKARNAVAFDLDGAPLTHRGERCSFDSLLEDFELGDPALERLAAIVRGADTGRLDLAPECAGLLAASRGLSECHRDDAQMLAAAMPLYDALYAWCRREPQAAT
ncbi:MAG TPA: chromate resistance protein ChrB domain-containing protein [Usitatibacter sp.]|jgi:rhodanese-related sulfurtransferase|nr:chromate resistance protein ChrB domain-containing protein [Usitatibacter sp.]